MCTFLYLCIYALHGTENMPGVDKTTFRWNYIVTVHERRKNNKQQEDVFFVFTVQNLFFGPFYGIRVPHKSHTSSAQLTSSLSHISVSLANYSLHLFGFNQPMPKSALASSDPRAAVVAEPLPSLSQRVQKGHETTRWAATRNTCLSRGRRGKTVSSVRLRAPSPRRRTSPFLSRCCH